MSLILHADSLCDICCDGYNENNRLKSPRSISCGHIFCLTCIRSLPEQVCPLCRSAFSRDQMRKVYIQTSSDAHTVQKTEHELENLHVQLIGAEIDYQELLQSSKAERDASRETEVKLRELCSALQQRCETSEAEIELLSLALRERRSDMALSSVVNLTDRYTQLLKQCVAVLDEAESQEPNLRNDANSLNNILPIAPTPISPDQSHHELPSVEHEGTSIHGEGRAIAAARARLQRESETEIRAGEPIRKSEAESKYTDQRPSLTMFGSPSSSKGAESSNWRRHSSAVITRTGSTANASAHMRSGSMDSPTSVVDGQTSWRMRNRAQLNTLQQSGPEHGPWRRSGLGKRVPLLGHSRGEPRPFPPQT